MFESNRNRRKPAKGTANTQNMLPLAAIRLERNIEAKECDLDRVPKGTLFLYEKATCH